MWDGWQHYQHPEQYIKQSAAINESVPKPQATSPAAVTPATIAQPPVQQATGKTIHIKTDILEAEISTIGGDISSLALLKHPDGLDKNKPLMLFQRGANTHNYVARSGVLGAGLPNHNSQFVSEQDQYVLSGNAAQVQVRLNAESD